MITENLSTLKIHTLTKEQYERELAAGRIDENALYLTPEENIQPDLSQNDPTAADYVKNRTHWEEVTVQEIVPEQTMTFAKAKASGKQDISALDGYLEEANVGSLLTVIWDGVSYECEVYKCYYDSCICIGNATIWGESGGNGEPFFIYQYPENSHYVCVQTAGTYTFSVVSESIYVEKLPERFLPDGAVVGKRGTYNSAEVFNDYENNVATANNTHAEGYFTTASGESSHAQNINTTASGLGSHAEGHSTIAASQCQHAQGKYNIEDTASKYAHIVGNGTSDTARSNAHTLDWDGNAWFAGGIKVGGTGQDDTAASVVPAVSTATVGQTIVVKAVDENGKPTEWEAVDIPKDFMVTFASATNEDGDTVYSADKTFEECAKAFEQGKCNAVYECVKSGSYGTEFLQRFPMAAMQLTRGDNGDGTYTYILMRFKLLSFVDTDDLPELDTIEMEMDGALDVR